MILNSVFRKKSESFLIIDLGYLKSLTFEYILNKKY